MIHASFCFGIEWSSNRRQNLVPVETDIRFAWQTWWPMSSYRDLCYIIIWSGCHEWYILHCYAYINAVDFTFLIQRPVANGASTVQHVLWLAQLRKCHRPGSLMTGCKTSVGRCPTPAQINDHTIAIARVHSVHVMNTTRLQTAADLRSLDRANRLEPHPPSPLIITS